MPTRSASAAATGRSTTCPSYKGKGKSLEQNPFDWHNYDYLKYYDQVFGRACGAAGIGKLKQVGLLRVSEDDDYANHPYVKEDPGYMDRDGFLAEKRMDIARMNDEQQAYAEALQANGVEVYWIRYPERPMAAFGPMTNQMSAAELLIVPGGSIIPKKGYALAPTSGFGRTEYLARWAFWNLSIAPLVTVIGKAGLGGRRVLVGRRVCSDHVGRNQRGRHAASRAGIAARLWR